jgi:predicted nucleic acid-binding protein
MGPMPILIDSTVLIDVLRGHQVALAFLADARRSTDLMSVTPVRTEVLGGVRNDMLPGTYTLLRRIDWIDVTVELADAAAVLQRRHRATHGGIGTVDYLLAAAALELGGFVATSNVRDFPMFPGLQPPY